MSDEKKEMPYEKCVEIATNIARNLYSRSGSGGGRSLKPTKHDSLVQMFLKGKYGEVQKNGLRSKPKPIVTLGVFEKMPKDICMKINDKAACKKLKPEEYADIAAIIIGCIQNPNVKYLVHTTDDGMMILANLVQKKEVPECLFDVRTIFATQERQLILG
jgi:hypothetical protein